MMQKILFNVFYIGTTELQHLLLMTEREYLLEKLQINCLGDINFDNATESEAATA